MGTSQRDLREFLQRCADAAPGSSLCSLSAENILTRRLGSHAELCERLLGYIIAREKTGVFSQPSDFPDGQLPRPGEYAVLTDFLDRPRCLIRYEECAVIAFRDLGPEHIAIETPPMRDIAKFRAFHRNYWTPILEARGERFTEDMPIVYQRFTCLYPPVVD